MTPDHPRLAHSILEPNAERYWVFLHGILGSRSNWRSLARKTLAALNSGGDTPRWGAVLVDLRHHGESRGFSAPNTLVAAAADVRQLCDSLDRPVEQILGHSFGGKVALSLLEAPPASLRSLWVIDSQPGPILSRDANDTTTAVIAMLQKLTGPFANRHAFVDEVVAHGHDAPFAQWLSMNLVASDDNPGQFDLGLDLTALSDLLQDYDAQNLWPLLTDSERPWPVQMVLGEKSTVLSADDQQQLQRCPKSVTTHVIANAGHWVHVDAPEALLKLLTANPSPTDPTQG